MKAIVTGLQTLPTQKILSLMAVTFEAVRGKEPGKTTPLYKRYKKYCQSVDADHRSKKRFRDFLSDHENGGLIRKKPGRGQGKENSYWLDADVDLVLENLPASDERLGGLADNLRKKA